MKREPAQGLFYFVSGRGVLTHVEQDEPTAPPVEVIIGEVRPNEYVGENALFSPIVEHATLRIVESSIVLFLSRQRLASVLLAHPELRTNLGLQRGDQHKVVKLLFKGQRPDEVVLQIFKRHWWSYARFVWIPVLVGTMLIVGAFLAAGILARLGRRIGLPTIPFFMAAGIIFGPHTPGLDLVQDPEDLELLAALCTQTVVAVREGAERGADRVDHGPVDGIRLRRGERVGCAAGAFVAASAVRDAASSANV